MRAAFVVGLGLVGLISSETFGQQPVKTTRYEGAYDIVSGEDSGKKAPEEHLKGSSVRITGDTIVVADKDEKELYVAKYEIDTKNTPTKITMTETGGPRGRKGSKAVGIIDQEGDRVRLCYAYEGGIVPTEFKTKAGEKQNLFVLKRKDKDSSK